MKKIIALLILVFYTSCTAAAVNRDGGAEIDNFSELGRFVRTLEANDDNMQDNTTENDNSNFENEAIEDVLKFYDKNAVELKLDNVNDEAINAVNGSRIFRLKVNETQYHIENNIKSENMIWDGSKAFSQAFINNSRRLAPIPSVINSSKIDAKVSDRISASFGQTFLNNSIGTSVLFIRANESTYNTGSVLKYNSDKLNIAAGSFASSFNQASSGGVIISSGEMRLPVNTGSFMLGGAYMNNEQQNYNKNTGGFFAEYRYKRLKLNAQTALSRYTNSDTYNTSFYLIPELQITDSLSLKTRFIRNVTQDTMQDEFVLNFKPKKNNHNLELELSATNQYTDTSTIKQRIKFSTSFKI